MTGRTISTRGRKGKGGSGADGTGEGPARKGPGGSVAGGPGARAAAGRGGAGAAGSKTGAKAGSKEGAATARQAAAEAGEGGGARVRAGPPRRGSNGFRHMASAGEGQLRGAMQRRGFAEAKVLTEWDGIMGEALAPLCRPVKVDYGSGGFGATLVVMAESARAPEVDMLRPRILERVNAFYGYRAISRVRVVQTSPGAGGGGTLAGRSRGSDGGAAARRLAMAISPEEARAVAGLSGQVRDGDLRDALDRLGRNVIRRRKAEDEEDETR